MTLEVMATVTADGKLTVDAPPGLEPGVHRVRLEIEEAVADKKPLSRHAGTTFVDGVEYYYGRRVWTEEERKKMNCPFPPEPEWEKEWENAEKLDDLD